MCVSKVCDFAVCVKGIGVEGVLKGVVLCVLKVCGVEGLFKGVVLCVLKVLVLKGVVMCVLKVLVLKVCSRAWCCVC